MDEVEALNAAEQEQMDVGDIFRSIYYSCDIDNTDSVPVSNLIEFVKPYLMEDLNALEDLRSLLDPEGVNTYVSSKRFYEVMSDWSQKLVTSPSNEDADFETPNLLTVADNTDVPFVHSTPRTSLGDKLLKCKDLLNLSNVSGYSLSSSRLDHPTESEKTMLEEEVKKLEHQLLKTSNELVLTKQQLAASEDQNDQLQQDLERINRRLHAEQQVNEHLQKDVKYNEELRDELNCCKKSIDELKKKLSQSEKHNLHQKNLMDEIDEEKIKLEKKIKCLSSQHQDRLKELFDVKHEVETKEEEIAEITKAYNKLKQEFSKQKDFIDQLKEENDLLNHQKLTLEKKSKISISPHPDSGNILNLSKTPSPHFTHTFSPSISSSESPYQNRRQMKHHQSMPLLRKVFNRPHSTPMQVAESYLDDSPPEILKRASMLSPIRTVQPQGSSDEDFCWKLQGIENKLDNQDLNGTAESLHSEMYKVDPVQISDSGFTTILFIKDERIAELEDEVENLTKLIIELKNSAVLLKNESDLGQLQNKISTLEATLKETATTLCVKTNDVDSLNQKLINAESVNADFDKKLQDAMKDLGKMTAKNVCLQGNITTLQNDNISAKEKLADLTDRLESISAERNALREERTRLEELNTEFCLKNSNLENECLKMKQDLECARSKCESLTEKVSDMERQLRDLSAENANDDEGFARYREDKAKLQNELKEFKKSLEKKLVAEFEGKVKYSLDSEERILNLTQKCTKQEEEIDNLRQKFNSKIRTLADTENQLSLLNSQNTSLQKEITNLNASKTELEIQMATMKAEHHRSLTNIGNIDLMAAEIQTHIRNKNSIIEELKQLNCKLETNLNAAQLDLREKVDDILELRNDLTKDLDIKNVLWKKVKVLERDLDNKIADFNKIEADNQNLIDTNKELKIEYHNLLIIYDLEVNKNCKLAQHVAKTNEEKNQCLIQCQELKIELNKAMATISEESEKNQHLKKKILELETKLHELEVNSRSADRHDFASQTIINDMLEIDDSRESAKLLDELETKLNEEINKNKSLVNDLLEWKNNYLEINKELLNIKRKLADNEEEMSKTLQEKCDKIDILTKDISKAKECMHHKDNEISKIEKELRETKETLELEQEYLNQKREKYDIVVEELAQTKEFLGAELERNIALTSELKDKDHVLQEHESLAEELLKTKDMINKSNIELNIIASELQQTKELAKELAERNLSLSKKLEDKSIDLQNVELKLKASQEQFEENNKKLFDELTKLNIEYNSKQTEIDNIKHKYKLFKESLDLIQLENNQLKQDFEENQDEKRNLNEELAQAHVEIAKLKESLSAQEITNVADLTKQEKDVLNLNQELIRLTQNLADAERGKNKMNQRLQEELAKNKALFENFSAFKKERDKLSFDLKEVEALLVNSQMICNKKHVDLQNIQREYALLESKFNNQAVEIQNLEAQLKESQIDIDIDTSQKNALISRSPKSKTSLVECNKCKKETVDRDTIRGRTYSKQQITIDKLKDKIEHLESQLKKEKLKCQELQNNLITVGSKVTENDEELDQLHKQISEKQATCEALERRRDEIVSFEEKLEAAKSSFNEINSELENSGLMSRGVVIKATKEIGVQVDDSETCEGKVINKFTLASRPESPDSPSVNLESLGLASLKNYTFHTKSSYNIQGDSVLEIPSLDVNGFADDIVNELDLSDSSPKKRLHREELENLVTVLSLRLAANSNTIVERIEEQTEKYRCQYEEILILFSDISHRLRDHVCIGTAEPIGPVYALLEDTKRQLRSLVQNAGQVGVLICENHMKRCWDLINNYVAMLKQDNEALKNVARETTPMQTGLFRRKNRFTQDKPELTEEIRARV